MYRTCIKQHDWKDLIDFSMTEILQLYTVLKLYIIVYLGTPASNSKVIAEEKQHAIEGSVFVLMTC